MASRFMAAGSALHLALILGAFIPLRVLLSLRHGIVLDGDGAPQAGLWLARYLLGEVSYDFFVNQTQLFFSERSTQLLYPVLIAFQEVAPWSLDAHVLLVNSTLGAVMIVAAYHVGVEMQGKACGLIAAGLMCAISPLYWIARYAVVDNLFYALLPLFALFLIRWLRDRTPGRFVLMAAAGGALLLSRPESIIVMAAIAAVLAWTLVRRWVPLRTAAVGAVLAIALGAGGVASLLAASEPLRASLMERAHVAWALSLSSQSLLNRGGAEYAAIEAKYSHYNVHGEGIIRLTSDDVLIEELHTFMAQDAIEIIKADPWWYVAKIPLRALALLFPWTYQPWSVAHIAYEAAYTLFLAAGLLLLARYARVDATLAVLLAIPLSIWCFLSAYGIDNDLKHRNGILVGLNLVAPIGYFVTPWVQALVARLFHDRVGSGRSVPVVFDNEPVQS